MLGERIDIPPEYPLHLQHHGSVKSTPVKKSTSDSPIMIDDDDDEDGDQEMSSATQTPLQKQASADSMGDSDSLPDLDAEPVSVNTVVEEPVKKEKKPVQERARRTTVTEEQQTATQKTVGSGNKAFARRSTTSGKTSRFKNLPDPKKSVRMEDVSKEEEEEDDQKEMSVTRSYFQDGQDCYIMDAKSMGNIGRYLNHSCTPNVFVQNVFVDTHDLRFPWVTFWAGQYIRAGTELTWDYNYEVGSVPGKVLYCYCGSSDCRGRLL